MDETNEKWAPVIGYEATHQVSSCGKVKALERKSSDGRLLKERVLTQGTQKGYAICDFRSPIKIKRHYIHRLVAEAFLGKPDDISKVVNHIDGNRKNNHVENLEWITRAENTRHGNMKVTYLSGTEHWNAKFSDKDIQDIKMKKSSGISGRIIAKEYRVANS